MRGRAFATHGCSIEPRADVPFARAMNVPLVQLPLSFLGFASVAFIASLPSANVGRWTFGPPQAQCESGRASKIERPLRGVKRPTSNAQHPMKRGKGVVPGGGLNSRPRAYESPALPLSYPGVAFWAAKNNGAAECGKRGVRRFQNFNSRFAATLCGCRRAAGRSAIAARAESFGDEMRATTSVPVSPTASQRPWRSSPSRAPRSWRPVCLPRSWRRAPSLRP